jgi:hypothetical protein
MGNLLTKRLVAFGFFAVSSLFYGITKLRIDYVKKNIVPIKNLKPGDKVSIEGRVRCLHSEKGAYEKVFEKRITNTYQQSSQMKEYLHKAGING